MNVSNSFPELLESEYLTLRCVIFPYMEIEVQRLKKLGVNLHDQVTDEIKQDVFNNITNKINHNQGKWMSHQLDGKILFQFLYTCYNAFS